MNHGELSLVSVAARSAFLQWQFLNARFVVSRVLVP